MPSITSVGLHASGKEIKTVLQRNNFQKPEFASLNSMLIGDEFTRLPKYEPTSADRLADKIPAIHISEPTPPTPKQGLPYPEDTPPIFKPQTTKTVKAEEARQEEPLDTPFRDKTPVELGVAILHHQKKIRSVINSLKGKSLSSDPEFMDKLQKLDRLKADQDLLRYEYKRRPALEDWQKDAMFEAMADHYTFSPQGKRYWYPEKIAKKDL